MDINLIQHTVEGEIITIFTGALELFLPFPDTSEQDAVSMLKLSIQTLDAANFPDGIKSLRYASLMNEYESGKLLRLQNQLALVTQPLQIGASDQFVLEGEVPSQNEWYKFWVDRETKTVQHKTLIELRSKSTGNTLRPHAFTQDSGTNDSLDCERSSRRNARKCLGLRENIYFQVLEPMSFASTLHGFILIRLLLISNMELSYRTSCLVNVSILLYKGQYGRQCSPRYAREGHCC